MLNKVGKGEAGICRGMAHVRLAVVQGYALVPLEALPTGLTAANQRERIFKEGRRVVRALAG